jgi:amidophosphoribosyltransferase
MCQRRGDSDKARPNCAIFGIFNHPKASIMTYYALHALQHRGQEAAGISTIYFDEEKQKKRFAYTRGEGLVLDVFSDPKILTDVLKGDMAVGHNRYSTTGSSNRANIQPFNMIYHSGLMCLAHNGNLTNTKTLRKQLHDDGAIFQTTTDSELFMHLVARSKEPDTIERVRGALKKARGAYSLAIITDDYLIAARDPHGVRPLSIGRLKVGDEYSYVVASETAAFDIIGAEYIRSVKHNEMIVIDRNTVATGEFRSFNIEDETPKAAHCIFEYIYFSRPDSLVFGHSVDKVRRKLGKNLAIESPIKSPDGEKVTVIPVPDSGNTATLGYARVNNELSCPTKYELGLIRSHYVGRTFIAPGQDNREFKVKTKFNTVKGLIEDKHLVVIDDSIVRGTTSKALLNLIKEAKPKSLHMKITSPPIKYPCHYGMDFPSREELIANDYPDQDAIGKAIGADSMHYLSAEKLLESVPKEDGIDYCTACFTGHYPIEIEQDSGKQSAED